MTKLMSTTQVAEALGVSRISVWRWGSSGALPSQEVAHGGETLRREFYPKDVATFVSLIVVAGRWKHRGPSSQDPSIPMGENLIFKDPQHAGRQCFDAFQLLVIEAEAGDTVPDLPMADDRYYGPWSIDYPRITAEVRRAFGQEAADAYFSLTIPF